jgi:hypothetical protein
MPALAKWLNSDLSSFSPRILGQKAPRTWRKGKQNIDERRKREI